MSIDVHQAKGGWLGLLLILTTMLAFTMSGCSGSGAPGDYDEPQTTGNGALPDQASNVLIDAARLQDWIDQGLVNNDDYYEKVVILDVTDPASYGAGHIPGAQLWNNAEQLQTRVEGPAAAINMVLDGVGMDAMIQKHGIDERTTIVLTTSVGNPNFLPSRAYFLFRYWGWDKSQLKVLNGYNGAWTGAGKALTSDVPSVTASAYSVKDNGFFDPDQRASLSEMITALTDGIGVPLDLRFSTPTRGVTGDYVVFDGVPRNGQAIFVTEFSNPDATFKSAAEIENALTAIGIDGTEVVYPFCNTGFIASSGYFVLDALLDWDVMLYDGSWSQWGQMSDDATKGGELPAGSLWATDNLQVMDVVNYNISYATEALDIDAVALALYPDPFLPEANQIENEDAFYMESGGGTSSGGGAAPGYGN